MTTGLRATARMELLDRLPLFAAAPRTVLDLDGAVTGIVAGAAEDGGALRRMFPGARIIATRDPVSAVDAPAAARPRARVATALAALRRLLPGGAAPIERIAASPARLPLAGGSIDLALGHWLAPGADALDGVLAELRRVLAPGGLFLWTTPGLGAAAEPLDMHDLGAALARAGFAEPVLDVDRHRGPDGVTEVIHAAAFAGSAPRARGETVIPLDRLGRRRGPGDDAP
jgi:malonyl-CoA O-methyltransferase